MSVKIISKAWDIPCSTHTEKLVLIALADISGDDGICWPSIPTLAAKCDLSEQGVRDQLAKLKSAGLVQVEARKHASHLYYVLCSPEAAKKGRQTPPRDLPSKALTPNTVDHPPSTALATPSTPDVNSLNTVDPNRKEPPKNRNTNTSVPDLESLKALALKLPSGKCTEQVAEAWADWIKTRMAKAKCKDWAHLFASQIKILSRFEPARIISILEFSTSNNYQGLIYDRDFAPAGNRFQPPPKPVMESRQPGTHRRGF